MHDPKQLDYKRQDLRAGGGGWLGAVVVAVIVIVAAAIWLSAPEGPTGPTPAAQTPATAPQTGTQTAPAPQAPAGGQTNP